MERLHDRIRGACFAGAYGDASGYAAEMSEDSDVTNLFDDDGGKYLRLKVESKAIISQNTQLALFTANGLLFGITRCAMRGIGADLQNYVDYAFDEWEQIQTGTCDKETYLILQWKVDFRDCQRFAQVHHRHILNHYRA